VIGAENGFENKLLRAKTLVLKMLFGGRTRPCTWVAQTVRTTRTWSARPSVMGAWLCAASKSPDHRFFVFLRSQMHSY